MKRKKDVDNDNGFGEWDGGYMGAKKSKLEEQYREEAAKNDMFKESDLFSGISIFVNGYTTPTAGELKRMMMTHGGIYHHYKRSHTKYTIASNLPDVKIKAITTEKIIRPNWIVDSIRENRLLDYSRYLLHSNQKESQPKLQFQRKDNTELANIMLELDALNAKMNESLQRRTAEPECVSLISSSESSGENREVRRPPPSSPDLFELEEQQFELENGIQNYQPQRAIDTSEMSEEEVMIPSTPPPAPVPERKNKSYSKSIELPKAGTKTARTATDPNFLSEFFQNSRLHHISTLGAGFKQHITELREKSDGKFPKRDDLKKIFPQNQPVTTKPPAKIIMHIDMDCFFVSVGLRTRPHLRGQPVAVTHSKGAEGGGINQRPGMDRQQEIAMYNQRFSEKFEGEATESRLYRIDENDSLAEIASCSYEARERGVKNGMFVGAALKLCPNLKTIPYDFEGYKEVANHLYATIAQYTLDIEAVSCDEMFVDLTELLTIVGISCETFVEFVRSEIKEKTQCPCSAGVGSNRLQARLATRKAKPDGQFQLRPEDVSEYMTDIQISDLPGVGRSTGYRLRQLKWQTCGDLQQVALAVLQREFGKKFGETLFQCSRGIDPRPLVFGQIRKSVSVEVNYGIRFTEQQEVETFLRQMCEEVHKRLTEIRQTGKSITLKVMVRAKAAPVETAKFMGHGFCDSVNKSVALTNFTGDLEVITYNVLSLMKQLALPPSELRGIGIQISKFPAVVDAAKGCSNTLKQMFQNVERKRKPEIEDCAPNLDNSFVESLRRVAECVADMTMPEDTLVETMLPPPKSSIVDPPTPTKKHSIVVQLARSPVSRVSIEPQPSTSRVPAVPVQAKKRGRPRKVDQVKKNMPKLFKNLFVRQEDDNDDLEGLDAQVLAELPDDIREEVIRDHKRQRKIERHKKQQDQKKVTQKRIQVDSEFLEALPLALRQQVEEQIKKDKDKFLVTDNSPVKAGGSKQEVEITTKKAERGSGVPVAVITKDPRLSEDNVFMQTDWRQQIRSWIESAGRPEAYDVEMLAKNAQELVAAKKIEQLYVAFKLLYRLVNDKNVCDWHQAYTKITNYAQSEMFDVYQSKLRVQCSFKCQNEECNSFI